MSGPHPPISFSPEPGLGQYFLDLLPKSLARGRGPSVFAGRTAHRRDRDGDREVEVVGRDRPVGCRRLAGRAGHSAAARVPAEASMFRWAFTLVSADVLNQIPLPGADARAFRVGGRLVSALDGEAVRGAKGKIAKAPNLVAALPDGAGAVPGQFGVDARSNKVPAFWSC